MPGARPVRIANCSGFYGDRISAAREMVEGGPIDVLTGDWLAELTMLILWKAKARNADGGYANTFLTQMEQVLGDVRRPRHQGRHERRRAQPGRVRRPGARHRRQARRVRQRRPHRGRRSDGSHRRAATPPDQPRHRRPRSTADPVSANAYLGGWGIARALARGRRRRRLPARHRRRRRRRPGGVVVGMGPRPTGTAWPARSRPVTSSSAAPRRPAATSRSSRSSGTSAHRSGSRSPRWTTTARPSSPSIPAPVGGSRSTP